jgi:hypothetical protein
VSEFGKLSAAQLVYAIRAERHHERLKHKLTRPRRAKLEAMLPRMIEEARRRGIPDELIFKWREYPAHLSFRLGVDQKGEVVLSPPPKRRANRMGPTGATSPDRSDRSPAAEVIAAINGPAPTRSAGDLLAALEHELAERMDGDRSNGRNGYSGSR